MSTRPRASFRAKRLTLLACLMMVAAALLFFGPAEKSLACPDPPMPLRPLYMASQSVVVARADKSVILQTEKVDPENDFEQTLLRTTFYVSKTLKGEGEQVVHVYTWLWADDRSVPEQYAEGKQLLLFLAPREQGDGYEVTDASYGAKALSEDDLKVYVERIEELAKILSAPKLDKAEIVEWLVRCAEEPATSWEGAYELSLSQDFLNRGLAGAEEKRPESEEAAVAESTFDEDMPTIEVEEETGEETESTETGSEAEDFSPYDAEMARMLTAQQKKRLAHVLFSQSEFKEEDWALFSLVQSWGDERMKGFIISYLEKVKDDPGPYADLMVIALADELKDEKLSAMAKKFSHYDSNLEDEAAPGDGDKEKKSDRYLIDNLQQKRSARLKRFLAGARSVIDNQIAMTGENLQ